MQCNIWETYERNHNRNDNNNGAREREERKTRQPNIPTQDCDSREEATYVWLRKYSTNIYFAGTFPKYETHNNDCSNNMYSQKSIMED